MKEKSKAMWITRTALFIALTIIVQALTRSIPNPAGQYVTGSLVNLITIVAVLMNGLAGGVTVAALTPWLAFLLGVGPGLIQVVPCIMLGNIALVLVWYFIAGKTDKVMPKYIIATVVGALVKFVVLYLLVVQLLINTLHIVPEKQSAVMSGMFSFPQLITAIIGGVLVIIVVPLLKKGLANKKS